MSKRSVSKAKRLGSVPSFKELTKAGQNKETVLTDADIEVVDEVQHTQHVHSDSCNH